MDQMVILQRILQILQQKIAMGAGGAGGIRRIKKAGYLDSPEQGGVLAGKRKKKTTKKTTKKTKKAGVSAGVSAGKKTKKAGVSAGKAKKTSKWIDHVKAYRKKHNCSYSEALSKAGASYKK